MAWGGAHTTGVKVSRCQGVKVVIKRGNKTKQIQNTGPDNPISQRHPIIWNSRQRQNQKPWHTNHASSLCRFALSCLYLRIRRSHPASISLTFIGSQGFSICLLWVGRVGGPGWTHKTWALFFLRSTIFKENSSWLVEEYWCCQSVSNKCGASTIECGYTIGSFNDVSLPTWDDDHKCLIFAICVEKHQLEVVSSHG